MPRFDSATDIRGERLSARTADQIIGQIAKDAKSDEFTPYILCHTFGTRLIRQGHDLVVSPNSSDTYTLIKPAASACPPKPTANEPSTAC